VGFRIIRVIDWLASGTFEGSPVTVSFIACNELNILD